MREQSSYAEHEMQAILTYIRDLHPQPEHCFVRMFERDTGKQYMYTIQHLQTELGLRTALQYFGKHDIMLSLNTFRSRLHATKENLFSINAIALDVDFRVHERWKRNTPQSVFHFIEADYIATGKIPKPTYVEYGNQLRLIYLLEKPVYLPKGKSSARILCERVTKCFARTLSVEFRTEAQPLESFVRIPYGLNTKNGVEGAPVISIMPYAKERYTLEEFQTLWLDDVPKWYERWNQMKDKPCVEKTETGKAVRSNPLRINKNRLIDFELIQSYLNREGIVDGRKRLCFLYLNYSMLIYSFQRGKVKEELFHEALHDTYVFNNNFLIPLTEKEIRQANGNLKEKQFIYSNAKIFEFLGLSEDLGEELQLKSLYQAKSRAEINKDYYNSHTERIALQRHQSRMQPNLRKRERERYRAEQDVRRERAKVQYESKREQSGKLSRAEKNAYLQAQILELKEKQCTNGDIANRLNVSIATVKRHLQKMATVGKNER